MVRLAYGAEMGSQRIPKLIWRFSLVGWAVVVVWLFARDSGERTRSSPDADLRGDPAVWVIDSDHPPGRGAQSFTALVSRVGCSGGETGQVLDPTIAFSVAAVTVTFQVAGIPDGLYFCPSNVPVSTVVELGEALGDRRLIDGACSSQPAATTTHCAPNGVRWP
jgi:hypothetical protein